MNSSFGDDLPPHNSKLFTACFSVVAENNPNALSRILGPFTKRGLSPSHVYAKRMGAVGEDLQVDIHLADADADDDTARRLAIDIRGLWLVRTVLISDKHCQADIA